MGGSKTKGLPYNRRNYIMPDNDNVTYLPMRLVVRVGDIIDLYCGAKAEVVGVWKNTILARFHSLPPEGTYKYEDMPPLAPQLFEIADVVLKD